MARRKIVDMYLLLPHDCRYQQIVVPTNSRTRQMKIRQRERHTHIFTNEERERERLVMERENERAREGERERVTSSQGTVPPGVPVLSVGVYGAV